jgi:hypothetical protein
MRHRVAVALPPADAIAEAAIRRGRSVRRRQAAAGALAVVVLVVAASVVLLRPGPDGAPPASPVIAQSPPERAVPLVVPDSPAPAEEPPAELPADVEQELQTNRPLPVDVVVADRLLTMAGRAVDLTAGVGRVAEAYQVGGGWLVLSSQDGGDSLWYVANKRSPRRLLTTVAAIVVAAAGDRVAWRDAEHVYVSKLLRNRLTAVRGTRVPAGTRPVGFVGDGLLLERRSQEEVVGSYAVWWPARGELRGRWRPATGVYGAMPDHRRVIAQLAGGKGPCLALLDALADLAVLEQRCDVPLTAGAIGWVSPDGRWLVAERTAAESVLIDVSSVFGGDKPAVAEGPRPNGPGAWTGGDTLVYGGTGYLARLRLDRAAAGEPDALERITVRGGADQPVLAVPRLS